NAGQIDNVVSDSGRNSTPKSLDLERIEVTRDNVADLFGVLLTSIKDIDDLTMSMEAGDCDDVLGRLTKDERSVIFNAILELVESYWLPQVIMSARLKFSADMSNLADANVDIGFVPNSDTPTVQSVSIPKPVSYAREAGASGALSAIPKKVRVNFHQLEYENVCDGVDLTIPRKVVNEGRSSFVRCLIEVSADVALKDSVTMGIPLPDGEGFTKETVQVEYEWKPSCCDHCKIFGHVYDQCPKNVTGISTIDKMKNDGFQMPIKQKVSYQPKAHGNLPENSVPKVSSFAKDAPSKKLPTSKGGFHVPISKPSVPTSNPYDVLDDMKSDDWLK
ncbi:zinc knuckle CX2CX4HX4C containing protein, partial [Tanacetum coccineum]